MHAFIGSSRVLIAPSSLCKHCIMASVASHTLLPVHVKCCSMPFDQTDMPCKWSANHKLMLLLICIIWGHCVLTFAWFTTLSSHVKARQCSFAGRRHAIQLVLGCVCHGWLEACTGLHWTGACSLCCNLRCHLPKSQID